MDEQDVVRLMSTTTGTVVSVGPEQARRMLASPGWSRFDAEAHQQQKAKAAAQQARRQDRS